MGGVRPDSKRQFSNRDRLIVFLVIFIALGALVYFAYDIGKEINRDRIIIALSNPIVNVSRDCTTPWICRFIEYTVSIGTNNLALIINIHLQWFVPEALNATTNNLRPGPLPTEATNLPYEFHLFAINPFSPVNASIQLNVWDQDNAAIQTNASIPFYFPVT